MKHATLTTHGAGLQTGVHGWVQNLQKTHLVRFGQNVVSESLQEVGTYATLTCHYSTT